MRVFLERYLEAPVQDLIVPLEQWTWIPEGTYASEIYGSGAPTKTRQSTYAGEKDNRSDSDRPNEGLVAA